MGGEQSHETKAEDREEETEKHQDAANPDSSGPAASEGTHSYSVVEVTEYIYSVTVLKYSFEVL